MNQDRTKRKLAAILSADVVGYSRLMEADEAWTIQNLEENKKLMSSLIEEFKGRVVDAPGDNLLAEFSSVVNAVECAVKIQKELKKRNSNLIEERRMNLRIGVNLGDVIEEDGRIYGNGVNIAARLENLAEPGGICISRTAYDQVRSKLDLGYEYLGEHTVKNITTPVIVYRVLMDSKSAGKVIGEKKATGRLPRLIVTSAIIVILIAAGLTGWIKYSHQSQKIVPASNKPEQTPVATDLKETPRTIAVLPFENLSSEKDQEYFADGMAEELINKLAQVKDLEVTARTSSFYFKGKNTDIRTIGETLGVNYLVEGSVRKSGNQLRVTAQLIKALDGYHLFSKTYDRELKDTFAIQDEIAKAVTTALSVTLGIGEFSRPGMTRSIEAYDEFLRAYANMLKLTPDSVQTAIDHYKKAVEIDPDFGLGWKGLRDAYGHGINILPPGQTVDFRARAAEAVTRARAIAPDVPEILAITAVENMENGNWMEADLIWKKILYEQDYTNSDEIRTYGQMLIRTGRNSDALQYLQREKRLDPLSPYTSVLLSLALLNSNRIDEALVEARRGQTLEAMKFYFIIIEFIAALEVNDRPHAADIITTCFNLKGDYPDPTMVRLGEILMMEDTEAALSELTEISKSSVSPIARLVIFQVASELGDAELAFEYMLESFGNFGTSGLISIWLPLHRAVRQLPAFKTFVRENGLYDYWRASGNWGDICHPVGEDDFMCQ